MLTYLEVLLEKTRRFHVHTHSGKNNGEVVIAFLLLLVWQLHETALTHNLRGNLQLKRWMCYDHNSAYLVVGQTSG